MCEENQFQFQVLTRTIDLIYCVSFVFFNYSKALYRDDSLMIGLLIFMSFYDRIRMNCKQSISIS